MSLEHSLTTDALRARYDDAAKHLLANKQILARILKECVREFRDETIPEIIHAISDDMEIGTVPLNPGLTNQTILLSQENSFSNEGTVFFDLLITAVAKHPVIVRVRIDLEPQNDYYPKDARIPRGIFYCARELSAQAETTFSLANQEYDKLEKVYSIWIFMNPSGQDSDTITSYSMSQKNLYGNFHGEERYDLLEVISICLCKDPDESKNDLIRILSILFSDRLTASEKITRLKNEGIKVNNDYGKEINHMCNLSEGVYNDGIEYGRALGRDEGKAEGIAEGRSQGREEGIEEGARNANIKSAESMLEKTQMSNEEISDLLAGQITPHEVELLRKRFKLN